MRQPEPGAIRVARDGRAAARAPVPAGAVDAPTHGPTHGPIHGIGPIRVMVVDDSAVIRSAIARILETDPGIRVVARAADGASALAAIGRDPVDIALLDIEMPGPDGLATLPLLLRAAPGLRVIMASTLTTRGADVTLRALRLGAADYIAKPGAAAIATETFRHELLGKVRALAAHRAARTGGVAASLALRSLPPGYAPPKLIAIGSSTGGPAALFTLVDALVPAIDHASRPPPLPPVPLVLTQHMPAAFTARLATQLGASGRLACREARNGDPLEPGTLTIAPGDRHLLVVEGPSGLQARLSDAEPENFCRPSVDPMLRSAAAACAGRVLVVMLTGMGQDGLAGTRRVVESGGVALAQDEATSVVWGMPGAIAQAGLCHAVLPLAVLAEKIRALLGMARR